MIERGLIERVEAPGRAVRHRLTASGTRSLEAGGRVLDQVLAGTLGSLSGAELTTLHALLLKAGSGGGPHDHAAGRLP